MSLYTAIFYVGFGVVKNVRPGLIHLLKRDGFAGVRETIGTATVEPTIPA